MAHRWMSHTTLRLDDLEAGTLQSMASSVLLSDMAFANSTSAPHDTPQVLTVIDIGRARQRDVPYVVQRAVGLNGNADFFSHFEQY
jgi:hypothetical protein